LSSHRAAQRQLNTTCFVPSCLPGFLSDPHELDFIPSRIAKKQLNASCSSASWLPHLPSVSVRLASKTESGDFLITRELDERPHIG
jgi:hypothetical protein